MRDSNDLESERSVEVVDLGEYQCLSFQQRRRQVVMTTLLIVEVLLLLVGSLIPIKLKLSDEPATPIVAGLSGADLFYFQRLPSWGIWMLNGRPLKYAPMLRDAEQPLRLSPGQYHLEWQAEPFQLLSCTFSVPSKQGEQTCKTQMLEEPNELIRRATLLTFPVALSQRQLPQAQREALIQSTQRLLDTLQGEEIVKPGEHYTYNQRMSVQRATEPLQAHLRFLLDTDTTMPANCRGLQFDRSCFIAENDCRLFCTLEWPTKAVSGWDVAAIIRPTWVYTPLKQPDDLHPQEKLADTRGDQQFVAFHVTWEQKQWKVSFHPQYESWFDDPNCISTMGVITEKGSPYEAIGQTGQSISWQFLSSANRATGCLAVASLQSERAREAGLLVNKALLLSRFGVLLTADEYAQQLWPQLPQALDEIQQLARKMTRDAVFVS